MIRSFKCVIIYKYKYQRAEQQTLLLNPVKNDIALEAFVRWWRTMHDCEMSPDHAW